MVRGLAVVGFMCLALLGGCGGESIGAAVEGARGGGAGGSAGASGGTTPTTGGDDCRVTFLDGEQGETSSYVYRFDPEQRTLATRTYFYELDDAGRTVKVYGNQDEAPVWYWTDTYDTYGNVTSNDHYSVGMRTYVNVYEDGVMGPRLQFVIATGQGSQRLSTMYEYDDAAAPDTWTRAEEDDDDGGDSDLDRVVTRALVDGRPESIVIRDGLGTALSAWYHEYDADGRIVVVERDAGYWPGDGPDDIANIRWRWTRDDAGNVSRFEQDGTDSLDDPHVNDLPDYAEDYSSGCRPLLTMLPWLAHEPGPYSLGPLFRTSRF